MRKFTSVLLALVLCAALLCIGAAAADSGAAGKFAGGDGSETTPYQIATAEQLKAVEKNPGAHYVLIADIDLEGSADDPWNPIGKFTGTFDGNGHTISGLYMNANSPGPADQGLGLFSYLGSGGTIKNLTVEGEIHPGEGTGEKLDPAIGSVAGRCDGGEIINCTSGVNITGHTEKTVGGIVAGADGKGTIENCHYTGTINITINSANTMGMGGIVGQASDCTVENCENAGTVISDIHTGGVVGRNNSGGEVLNCRNSGIVESNNPAAGAGSGGIVGDNYGVIRDSYNASTGIVTGGSATGGVTAKNAAENGGATCIVENCYNAGTVRGSGDVGGVVGHNNSSVNGYTATVKSSYNTGTVTGGSRTGGVVGYIESGVVENCYNTGDVTGSVDGSDAGGVVGSIEGNVNGNESTVSNCYNTGDVTGSGNAGGVVGKMDSESNTVSYCYYLEQDGLPGIGTAVTGTVTDVTSKTADEFADPGSFPNLDFKNTWTIADMGGFKRPVLKGAQETAVTYTVTVNGSCAEQSGAGKYSEGVSVTVSAGARPGYRFAGWTAEGVTLTNASAETVTFDMPAGNVTLTASWDYIVLPSDPTYPPTMDEPENGAVTTSPSRPEKGDAVTITPKPDEGFEVDEILVKDENGKEIKVTQNPDGTYTFTQPDGKVTITVTFRCDGGELCPGHHLTDVSKDAWYHAAVDYAVEHGIMEGMSPTTFAPRRELTRAEVVQVLYNLEGRPDVTGENIFTDTAKHWAVDPITWAATTGVVDGYGDDTFRPNNPVSRQEFAQMLYRYAKYKGYDLTAEGDLSQFPDSGKISEWAEVAMKWANGEGLIQGHENGTIDPTGTTIRAQAASILMRFDLNLVQQ